MSFRTKPLLLALGVVVSLAGAAPLAERRIDFENEELGQPPRYFTPAVTGDFKDGNWVVEEAEGAPSGNKALAQRDDGKEAHRFALCVYDSDKVADVDVVVQLKPLSGKADQGGGVVARHQDRDNYYVAQADALEASVHLYSVVQGKRTQIAGQPVAVDAGKWHKLRLVVVGRHAEVHFNDVLLFEADDDAIRDAGNVGLWTKADSVTLFDDFAFKSAGGKKRE